jgi:stage V sporulation protein B
MVSGAVVKIVSSYVSMRFLLPEGKEMFGAPIGTVLCYMTIVILNFVFIAKKVGLVPDFGVVFLKPFIAAVPCVLVSLAVYNVAAGFHAKIATLLAIFAAVAVYFVAVLLLRAITKEEVLMIPKGQKIYGLLHKMKLM